MITVKEDESMSKEKQKQEAIRRMKALKIMPQVIEDFKNNDRVYYSERQNAMFNAVLYWLDNHDEYVQIVKDFEKEHKALVYHCQLTHTRDGDLLSLFYVSKYENLWNVDKYNIENKEVFAYVHNMEYPWDSDFGYIGVRPSMGGIVRTA